MRKTLCTILLAGAASLACHHGDSTTATRRDQQYDVVQEGAASGVTSTINAPGETVATPPLTATNADTTSNFALEQTASTDTSAPLPPGGTLAGGLPAVVAPGSPAAPRPVPQSVLQHARATSEAMPRSMTSSSSVPMEQMRPIPTQRNKYQPPPTDTTSEGQRVTTSEPAPETSTQPPPRDSRWQNDPNRNPPRDQSPAPATSTDGQPSTDAQPATDTQPPPPPPPVR